MYSKRYNKKQLLEIIEKSNKKSFNIEDLLFEIDFTIKDVNKFYVKHIKHRIRYEKD